jgi:hypothetical protein
MGFIGSLTGGKCNLAEKTEEREREREGRDRTNRASQTKPPPLHSIKPHLFLRSLVSSPLSLPLPPIYCKHTYNSRSVYQSIYAFSLLHFPFSVSFQSPKKKKKEASTSFYICLCNC